MSDLATTMEVPERRALHAAPLVLAFALTVALATLSSVPRWAIYFPRDWTVPAAKRITAFMNYLADDLDFGLFTFSEMTRAGAWIVEALLLFIQGMLANGFEIYGEGFDPIIIPALPWIAVAGHECVKVHSLNLPDRIDPVRDVGIGHGFPCH